MTRYLRNNCEQILAIFQQFVGECGICDGGIINFDFREATELVGEADELEEVEQLAKRRKLDEEFDL